MKGLRGMFPILPTPFRPDGAVDCESLLRVADHLVACGVHGLGTLGLVSEDYKLSDSESRQVIAAVVQAAAGRVPVVAATSHERTRIAVQRSREAVDLGAAAVMLLPPYLVKPTPPILLEHFLTIARSVDVPVDAAGYSKAVKKSRPLEAMHDSPRR